MLNWLQRFFIRIGAYEAQGPTSISDLQRHRRANEVPHPYHVPVGHERFDTGENDRALVAPSTWRFTQ